MRRIIGSLLFVTLLFIGQVVWADETLRTIAQIGHVATITSISFSRDGNLICSLDEDNNIKVWHAYDGRLIRAWRNNEEIGYVTFGGDRNLIAFGQETLSFWEPSSGELIKKIKHNFGHQFVSDLDGSVAVSVSNNDKGCVIKVWQLPNGKLFRTLNTFSDRISSITLSPDGSLLASIGGNKEGINLMLWRVSDGSLIKREKLRSSEYRYSVAFSADSTFLGLVSGKNIRIWEISNWRHTKRLEGESDISSLRFSPDGSLLAAIDTEGRLLLWKVSNWSYYRKFELKNCGITSFAFSPNGHHLALGGGGHGGSGGFYTSYPIEVLSIDNNLVRNLYEERHWIESIVFSPDGRYLAFVEQSANIWRIKLFQVKDGNMIWKKENETRTYSVTFSPDGQYLAAKSFGIINIWQIPEGNLVKEIKFNDNSGNQGIAFSPDGQFIVSGGFDNSNAEYVVNFWKVSDGNLFKTLKGESTPLKKLFKIWSLAFSPNGDLLAAGGNNLIIWGMPEGDSKLFGPIDIGSILQVSFSPDGRLLSYRGLVSTIHPVHAVKILRLADMKFIKILENHNGFAFSPDGAYFATSSKEDVSLWRLSDGSLLQKIHTKFFGERIIFSPDSRLLAVEGDSGSIEIYRTANGELLTIVYPFSNSSVIFTPEGFFSGTGDFNKYVHFVKDLEVYDFNQFYDAFYRPDLVEKKLRGEDISKYTGGLNIEDAIKNPPPKVSILSPSEGDAVSSRTISLKVQIQDTGGEIGDIRVHHNGKLVDSLGIYRFAKPELEDKPLKVAKADIESPYQTIKRGTVLRRVWDDQERKEIKVVDFTPLKGTIEKTYTVTLINGENTISVAAFNGTNTVMSAMESIKVRADIPEKRPELYVLSVGNDHFANAAYNLRMAVKDSKDFSDMLKKVATPLYQGVHVKTLADSDKASVIDAITSMSAMMNPEDTFILFAATHGRAEDDLYYLYTSGFDGEYRNPRNYISSVELMELSKRVPALKQVFIFDTCQAGGVEAIVSGLYDSRISVLAKALGMHIFAGTKTYQEAQDSYKENGLFTYFVLRGVEGQADENNNREVTVFEMNPYLSTTVKEASKGTQEPFIKNFGDDLPLSKVVNQ